MCFVTTSSPLSGSTGVDGADFVDYEYGINEEGEEDRQDLGLVGIFGVRYSLGS